MLYSYDIDAQTVHYSSPIAVVTPYPLSSPWGNYSGGKTESNLAIMSVFGNDIIIIKVRLMHACDMILQNGMMNFEKHQRVFFCDIIIYLY